MSTRSPSRCQGQHSYHPVFDEADRGGTDYQSKLDTRGQPFVEKGKGGPPGKRAVVTLVKRGGRVRCFGVDKTNAESVREIGVTTIRRESRLHTAESRLYTVVGTEFARHDTVRYSAKECARGDVHTNKIEGVFSIFKRGMKGVYQHCAEKQLHRYLAEFDFRYNNCMKLGINDTMRAETASKGVGGKRLNTSSRRFSLSFIAAKALCQLPLQQSDLWPRPRRRDSEVQSDCYPLSAELSC